MSESDSFFYRLSFFVGVLLIGVGLFAVLMHFISADTVSASVINPAPGANGSSASSIGSFDPLAAAAAGIKQAADSAGRAISTGMHSTTNALGSGSKLVIHSTSLAAGGAFAYTEHSLVGKVSGPVSAIAQLRSVIQPPNNMTPPRITQLRAQQAALIQSDTQAVSVAPMLNAAGGACDNNHGNGGYPASWCNAPMDSVATVPYSSDPINRECTSYAYWYFTSVEGHSNLRVQGNAKYWAATSNYPTHAAPAAGAIAVERAGTYGHVAIVQALPGQIYAGQKVPAGSVLVSEMNYDWGGHFRFSYSPVGKFSAYIYP